MEHTFFCPGFSYVQLTCLELFPLPPTSLLLSWDHVCLQITTTTTTTKVFIRNLKKQRFHCFSNKKAKARQFRLVCGSMIHSGSQALSNFLIHNSQWVEVVLIDKMCCCLPGLLSLFQSGSRERVKRYFSCSHCLFIQEEKLDFLQEDFFQVTTSPCTLHVVTWPMLPSRKTGTLIASLAEDGKGEAGL